ncbi:MAG: hypothetical protein CM15mP81_17630 [Alphaproteobacteria bacterium]|nr:MAG: hypothetical protein CM15mP81_17630 [Alphaproteobacteria bacterium]
MQLINKNNKKIFLKIHKLFDTILKIKYYYNIKIFKGANFEPCRAPHSIGKFLGYQNQINPAINESQFNMWLENFKITVVPKFLNWVLLELQYQKGLKKQNYCNDTFENKSIIEKIDNYFKDIKNKIENF